MRLLKYMLPLLALLIWSVTVSADYDPASPPEPGVNFTLTTQCVPQGAASYLTSTAPHAFGSKVDLRVSANKGFHFVQWEDEEGTAISTELNFEYSMPSKDVTLTARFIYDPDSPAEPDVPEFKDYGRVYLQVYPADAGSISGSVPGGGYYSGTQIEVESTISFTAYANQKYDFINWTKDGEVISEDRNFDYTVLKGNQTLVANFGYNPNNPEEPGIPQFYRSLTLNTNPIGAASTYGSGNFLDGSSNRVYYSGIADYYTFINWTDDQGEVVSEQRDFSYTMPNRNVTLTANFSYNYDPVSPGEPTDPTPPGSIAENMVAYPRFGMFDDTHVMILCETEGSTIHYTLDGSDPNAESPVYTEPVYVPNNLLVKAIAYKEGMEDSPIRSYQVTTYRAIAPIFTFVNRKIEITSDTEDAVIRYTLDFSEPTAESTVYTEPVQPEENCRIKAYASKEGLTDSKVSVFVYRRADYTVDAPTFSLNEEGQLVITPAVEGADTYYTYTPDGEEPTAESTHYDGPITLDGNGIIKAYTSHINYFDSPVGEYIVEGFVVERPAIDFTNPLLTLSTATANAQIRYTLDGTIPSESADVYSEPIRLTEDCHVVARGFKTNYEPSDTISFRYVYNDYKLPTPTASFANKVLTLTCEDSQAQIRYTTDDSEPTAASSLYDGPISLTEDCTVKFIAIRENFNNSDVNSFVFVYTTYRVATPAFNYDTVNKTISISCETEDAEIRYTTDGSDPTATTGIVYTGPIDVNGNATFTARAFRNDFFDSAAATLSINDQSVPTPTASFANLLLTISCEDPEAQIYYTTDGSTPTVESALYEGPVALTEDCTVKFIATHENFNNSPEGSYEFVRAYFAVTTPTFTYDRANQVVTIATTTEGAEIRYTTDGTIPEANTGTVYTGSVAVNGNANFIARAFKENMFPSETASLVIDDQKVPDPTASFANRVLTLSCPDSEAEIRYTTDGTEPTAQSALYEAPLSLAEDCTVRFIAMQENFNNSEVVSFTYVRTAYMVATPTFSYNSQNHSVTMACATENAEIRYTLDGSVPTATTGILYEGPITIVGNLTVNAVAFRSDLFDSELATLSITDQTVPTPTATFANKTLTLTCEDPEAEIHYTVDGTAPTAQSTLYSGPIALANDCLVNFIAIRANFNNSEPGSFVLVTADHSVATPAFNYDRDKQTVTIACDSVGAVIRYTTDGTVPTATTGTLYTEPISVNGNVTYTARAFRDDLYDSQPATLVIDDQKVPAPVASFGNRVLTLSCPDANARIYYTTDGTMPSAQSTLYQSPVALTQDCTVRFIAIRENFLDSDDVRYEFVRADHTVATPVINYQSSNHTITISCDTPNAEIRYTTDGTEPTATTGIAYTGSITVECNGSFNAKAFRSDLFDSAPAGVYRVTDMTVPTPTASFANKHLTLSCEDRAAEIRYTMDGSTPNAQSTLYEEPIAISEDCTIRFIAIRENFNNSAIATYAVICANYSVAKPAFDFDRANGYVTITCDTENAQIRYTTDGSVPTATTGTVYTDPISVNGNITFTARAFREDLYDSEPEPLVIDDYKVQPPVISFGNRVLTITCPTENAEIHYTIDGTTPTVDSPVYTAPVALTEDCTVRAFAILENYHDSEEATPFTFTRTAYMVETPVFGYNNETRMLTISCRTADAVIRYTTDGSIPTATTGNVYTEPVEIVGNRTINAVAFRSDLFDSEVATLRVTDQSVPVPAASYANRSIILACSDAQAQIRYTLDHSAPTAQSTLYENPIPMTGDCTVKFMATRESFNNSAVDSIVFKVAEHQEAQAKVEKDFRNRKITIYHTNNLSFDVTLNNETISYQEAVTLDVTPDMGSISVVTPAASADTYDSEPYVETLTFHQVPSITSNGHTATIKAEENVDYVVSYGDKIYSDDSIDLTEFGKIIAHVESDNAFRSDEKELTINSFNTGSEAGVQEGHRLSEVFKTWGDSSEDYVELQVLGELNREDLEFISTLPNLTTLILSPTQLADESYDSVLTGTNLETVTTNQAPEGILKGMPRLTTVVWKGENNSAMPNGRLTEAGNPNILLWVANKDNAPEDAANVVVEGKAESITLYAGHPFNAHKEITVTKIDFIKTFSQSTAVDTCRGWETIAIPFTATSISHERAGEIQPFKHWNGGDEELKPFWLYQASESGWEEAGAIEAGEPYIISMPNNPDYIEAYNLNGTVTFSAEDVTIDPEDSMPKSVSWIDGTQFEATFMPIEGNDISSLNCREIPGSDEVQGSKFIPEADTLPFECFMRTADSTRRRIPIFGDWAGLQLPTLSNYGVIVEALGGGKIRISSERNVNVDVFTPTGMRVRSVNLNAGESEIIDNLAKGIYIIAGKKISIN